MTRSAASVRSNSSNNSNDDNNNRGSSNSNNKGTVNNHRERAALSCNGPSVGSSFWSSAFDSALSYSRPLPRHTPWFVRSHQVYAVRAQPRTWV